MVSKGFSLIELMVVVAVVGILVGISIPVYNTFVVKAQVGRAVGELGSYKSGVEQHSSSPAMLTNAQIGYVVSPLTDGDEQVQIVTFEADGSGHLQVTMGGTAHPNVAGTIIRHVRTAEGRWNCVIDISAATSWRDAYRPNGCTVL